MLSRHFFIFFTLFFAFFYFINQPAYSASKSSYQNKASQTIPYTLQKKMANLNMALNAPILIRLYKEESILEIWKEDQNKNFTYLTSYPICRWSGLLGPKYLQGDLQSPEGFYTLTSAQLNPNSRYYLSINIGYPNFYDRAHGRKGSAVMIHGGCHSVGCYAMKNKNIGPIYALVRDAFKGGQKSIQVQAFPFRMSEGNMRRYQNDKNYPFWQNLKEGADIFEQTKRPVRVSLYKKRYHFQKDPRAPISKNETKSFYQNLSLYGQKIHDFLHQLRGPQKSLTDKKEAQKISDWTNRLIKGQPVASLRPPYNS